MREKLESLAKEFQDRLAGVVDEKSLLELKIDFLGKKAEFTALLKALGNLPADQRPLMGELINKVKADFEARITEKLQVLKEQEKSQRLTKERIDVTLSAPSQTSRDQASDHTGKG